MVLKLVPKFLNIGREKQEKVAQTDEGRTKRIIGDSVEPREFFKLCLNGRHFDDTSRKWGLTRPLGGDYGVGECTYVICHPCIDCVKSSVPKVLYEDDEGFVGGEGYNIYLCFLSTDDSAWHKWLAKCKPIDSMPYN